ncbi:1-acyl-sn-glycerol-3-phosphate acyltransferase [Oscillibacter valericigenes]|uniref:lysophospholipid acyltransferase family protein n=1 Tax=Oscillibacter valericigenes TaxID=351091 RepID=UPI001F1A2DC0|nr:lysophospholipid acyltransferase family protein [Oscillibacter valericigenes]MCF2664003.1 1-acyl-sn-glycerol-3-phosphate acyltransferase [Oscillibacter valericigenes]
MKPLGTFFVFAYYVVGLVCRILHPTTVEGLENLPEHGALLCPNHSSNWDPLLVVLRLPINYRVHIMAKQELFRFKPLAWALRHVGAFPVSRGDNDIQAVKTAIQAIKGGDNLLIFPEGTVIRNGIGCKDGLPAHAKAGVAVIGVRTGATMIPVFVDGEKKLFHRTRIIFGKPYIPVYTGRHGTSEEMQKIADDILAEAYALGGQTVGGEPL